MRSLLKKIYEQKRLFSIATAGSLFFAVVLVIAVPRTFASQEPLQQYADKIVQECASASDHPTCYDQVIPKLMQTLSMQDTFKVTTLIQQQDSSYWFCHALGHTLSTIEYSKDPSNWQNVVEECPVGMCSNGCIHGAIQAHFSSATVPTAQLPTLIPALSQICEDRSDWHPTPEEQSSCYHEIGHISMFLTGGDPELAESQICDKVSVKSDGRNFLQTCHEGVFMQIFEPREADDFAIDYTLIPDKKAIAVCGQYAPGVEKGGCWKAGWVGHIQQFCDTFSGDIRNACYREAWVVDSSEIKTAPGILSYCSYSSNPDEKTKCFNKLFYSLMSMTNFNYQYVESICETFTDTGVMAQCYANTASRLIETDTSLVAKAVGVCNDAKKYGIDGACWKELQYYANFAFTKGSAQQQQLCSLLPASLQKDCGVGQ